MTAPDGFTVLRMVAGPGTNPADMVWDQAIVVVPSSYPIGSGEGSPGELLGVRGYTRQGAGTPPLEFVMASLITPETVDTVNSIPGAEQWESLEQRQVFYDIGLAMIQLGHPPTVAETLYVLSNLFAASKAEVLAEIAAGRIPVTPPAV